MRRKIPERAHILNASLVQEPSTGPALRAAAQLTMINADDIV